MTNSERYGWEEQNSEFIDELDRLEELKLLIEVMRKRRANDK